MYNKKNILFLIKLCFFLALVYFVYTKLEAKQSKVDFTSAFEQLSLYSWGIFAFVFFLQFANWKLEALKFKTILKPENISHKDSFTAVYFGNATGFLTPDRLGNFIGRALFIKHIKKGRVISATLFGNFAQLLTTVLFALLALVIFNFKNTIVQLPFDVGILLLAVLTSVVILGFVVFYNPKIVLHFSIPFIRKHSYFLTHKSVGEKNRILFFAIARYGVFVLQFYLLLIALGAFIIPIDTLVFVGLLYLFTTLIPSPFFGNLGTREAVSVLLLNNEIPLEIIVAASLMIWFINIVIPSLIGSFFILQLKTSKTFLKEK